QEGAAEGAEAAVRRDAVHGGGHGVLPDAPVEEPAARGRAEDLEALERRAGALAQVGRAANEIGQRVHQCVERLRRGLPGGELPVRGLEGRKLRLPTVR